MPPAAAPPELLALPHYADLRPLGGGGMGAVFLARNTLLDRPEVLKVIAKDLLKKPGARDRFLREMRAAARLSHPNVVAAYAAISEGEFLALAMEYVPGRDLSAVVDQDGPLHYATAAAYARQAALGLQHAHEREMVHRDIKPANLMLSRGTVKILDFGLAKLGTDTDARLTHSGALLGTPAFLAPEQSLDAAAAGIQADLYSLGCTLHFLITGSPPYSGASAFSVLQAHLTAGVPDVRETVPDVPSRLAAVIRRLMAKDPANRYATPAEVALVLEPFAGVVPTDLSLPVAVLPAAETATGFDFPTDPVRPPSVLPAAKPKRHPAWYAGPAVAVVAVLGAAVALSGGKKPAEPAPVAKAEPTLKLPPTKKAPTPAPAEEKTADPAPPPTTVLPATVVTKDLKAAPLAKPAAPEPTPTVPAPAVPAAPVRKPAPAWKNVAVTQADIKSNRFKLPDVSKLAELPCAMRWKPGKDLKLNESQYVARALESGDMVQITGRLGSVANLNWWGFLVGDDNAGWLAVYVSNDGHYTTGPWPGNTTKYRLKNPPKDYPKVVVAAHRAIQPGTLPNTLTLVRRDKLLEVYVNEVGVCPPVVMPATLGTEVWIQMDVTSNDSYPGYNNGPTFRDARDFETPFVKRP